jgi:SAM-dependent methyltransferase
MRVQLHLGSLKRFLQGQPWFPQLHLVLDLMRGGARRSNAILRIRRPDHLFQPEGTTFVNRYPEVFRYVRQALGDGPDRHILSFGCSTGEELFSLRNYFDEAQLKGIDINSRSITICWRQASLRKYANMSFEVGNSVEAEAPGSFDAIFAMAVFRHAGLGDGPGSCSRYLRFTQFERATEELARTVKLGGYLAIRHANFRFLDTAAGKNFQPLLVGPIAPRTPHYGPDDVKLADVQQEYILFRKIAEQS